MVSIPDRVNEGILDFIQGALCNVLTVGENLNRLLANAPTSIGNEPIANLYRAARLRACGDDPSTLDDPPSLVTGGQCSGVFYQVRAIGVNTGNGNPFDFIVGTFVGPIRSGPRVSPPPPVCSPPDILSNIEFRAGDNSLIIAQVGCASLPQNIRVVATPINPADEPAGGCGNGPIVPPGFQGGPVTFEGDTTINIDDSTQITIPTAVIFAPFYVDIDGSLNIPVNIDVGGVNLSGTLELFPNFKVELFPNGLNPGSGVGTEDDDLVEPDPGGPETDPDDPDDIRRIIGVQITAQAPTPGLPSEILFANGPNIFAPRLGSCKFLVLVNDFSGWTNDIDIKGTEIYIPCPVPQGAIAVRCSPVPGVTLQWSPVRGRVRN